MTFWGDLMSMVVAAQGGLRRASLLGVGIAILIGAMAPFATPVAEAGKPGGGGATSGPTLTVRAAPGAGFDVIVSGSGYTAGKRVQVNAVGRSPAPVYFLTVPSSGTFSYQYTLPDPDIAPETGPDSWTFTAYEEAKGGWKTKASTLYVNLN